MQRFYAVIFLTMIGIHNIKAQVSEAFPASTVTYKVVLDDPKDLNNLWIHIQPVTLDIMQMNSVIGLGLDVTYVPDSKLELKDCIPKYSSTDLLAKHRHHHLLLISSHLSLKG